MAVILQLLPLAIANSVICHGPYMYSGFYDAFMEAFQMTHQQIGVMISVYSFGCMLFYIPSGLIADRFNPKKLLLLSLFSTAAVNMIMWFKMNYITAIVANGLFAITTCLLYWSTIVKCVRIVGGKDNSGLAFSFYSTAAAILGFVASMAEIWIYDITGDTIGGVRNVLLAVSAITALAGVLVAVFLKDDKKVLDELEPTDNGDKISLAVIPEVLKNKPLWIATIMMCLVWAINGGHSYFNPYLTEVCGMSVTQAAYFNNIVSYGTMACAPVAGYIADRVLHSTAKTYIVCMAVSTILQAVIVFFNMSVVPTMIIIILCSLPSVSIYGILWALHNEVGVPMRYASTAVGLSSLIIYCPDLFMYNIFGVWLDNNGPVMGHKMIFFSVVIMGIVSVLLAILLLHMIKNQKPAEA